jgi:hypothetical protein
VANWLSHGSFHSHIPCKETILTGIESDLGVDKWVPSWVFAKTDTLMLLGEPGCLQKTKPYFLFFRGEEGLRLLCPRGPECWKQYGIHLPLLISNSKSKIILSWAPVTHAYNPSYLGGWDWEDHHSRPLFRASLGKKLSRLLSQPAARYRGVHLSFQICREVQIGRSLSRPPWVQNETLS